MKVLTVKQPFAALITSNKKKIETRSWKTNYRGELYIHAGMKKVTKDVLDRPGLIDLIKDDNYDQYGFIICKCILKDCIYMTKEYIEKIKHDYPDEFICGRYEIGRYAWILDDIEVLKKPIGVKGQLGIWNYVKEK